jgi:hypothetical protein
MLRLSVALACLLGANLPLLGDDAAARERTVKVALALAGTATKVEKMPSRVEPVAAKLDWLVDVKAEKKGVLVAPPPKEKPVPAKAPQPLQELWLMSDVMGRQWYEWRDLPPKRMPASTNTVCIDGVCYQVPVPQAR